MPLRDAVRHLRDRFVASDPALVRRRSGLRALFAALIASALLLPAARALGLQTELALLGILVAVMAAVTPQEGPRGEQAMTFACIAVVASAVIVLGAFVQDRMLLSAACFVLTIYVAFQAGRFGARGTAAGTIAYQAYFYAMLLHPDPGRWGWLVLAVVAGCAIAALVRLVLVVQRPQRVLRHELHAWRAGLALLLSDLARSLQPGAGPAQRRRCDADLARLLDGSLAIEQRLAAVPADDPQAAELRDRLLRHELAAEALANCVVAARRCGGASRQRLASVLRAVREVVHGDAAAPAADLRQQARSALDIDSGLRWSCGEAMAVLLEAPPWAAPLPVVRESPVAAPSGSPGQRLRVAFSLDDRTRRAVQACAAAAGAIVAGRLISPEHWYWAVFAAFVLFTQANTREQAVSGAWQRTIANVAGLALGLAVAEAVQGQPVLQVVLLFVFIAIGFYGFRELPVLYGAVLTAMLAMLYELLGLYRPGVLLLRLAETLAGAAIAALSSALVLPVRTRDESDDRTVQVLRTAADGLRHAFGTDPSPPARDVLRRLDRELQNLRRSLGPVTASSYPAKKSPHRRRLKRLSRLVYCVRHLDALALRDPAVASALRRSARALATELQGGAEQLDAERHVDAAPAAVRSGAVAAEADSDAVRLAREWLREADAITRALRPRNRDLPRLQRQSA